MRVVFSEVQIKWTSVRRTKAYVPKLLPVKKK